MVESTLLKFFEITFSLLHQQLMITIFQQQIQENAEEIRTDQAKSQRWEQFLLVWKHAGVKKVPVRRIENITQQERLERQLIENLHHTELASVERENAIYRLWESGKFKSVRELAETLGYHHLTISDIIEAKEFRDRIGGLPTTVPTSLISETKELDDKTRLKILSKVARGEIRRPAPQTEIREIVKIVKKIENMKTCCIRYKCIQCCLETEMPLLNEDTKRIRQLGFDNDYFVVNRDGWLQLKNYDGRCVFNDGKQCLIYENRLEGCKIYLII